MPGIGRKMVSYMSNNAVNLVALAVTAVSTAAVATAGTKAVTTACLIGGGLFAGVVAFEVVKIGVVQADKAVDNIVSKVKESFADTPDVGGLKRADRAGEGERRSATVGGGAGAPAKVQCSAGEFTRGLGTTVLRPPWCAISELALGSPVAAPINGACPANYRVRVGRRQAKHR